MTVDEIMGLKPELEAFLKRFDGCFSRSEARQNLQFYVSGQLSDLQRKSAEPMALAAGIDERALQLFLSYREWDHEQLRQDMQRLIAAEHIGRDSIGIIDETGHPKKGNRTPGVQRQWCGNTGKIDNCIVTVHLAVSTWDGSFKALLDSDLFLPEAWDKDEKRRALAKIPPEVRYRPKWEIALEQVDRSRANGVHLAWITADEYYGSKPGFLAGLIDRRQHFVVEIPKSFRGWRHPPLQVTGSSTKPSTAENLAKHSPSLASQTAARYIIKTTQKGDVVWEARSMPFTFRDGKRIFRDCQLIVARNVLEPDEVKYFVAYPPAKSPLTKVLHVAFSRPVIEECFERSKDDLGLSHFEGRTYLGLQRHCYVTALTLLFVVRQTLRLREKKSGDHTLPGTNRHRRGALSVA